MISRLQRELLPLLQALLALERPNIRATCVRLANQTTAKIELDHYYRSEAILWAGYRLSKPYGLLAIGIGIAIFRLRREDDEIEEFLFRPLPQHWAHKLSMSGDSTQGNLQL